MKNTSKMWDNFYEDLNVESYSKPPQSFYDFPDVNRALKQILVKLGLLKKSKSLLELGCGGANISLWFANEKDKIAVAVDFSDKIEKYVNNAIKAHKLEGKIKFIKSDVLKFKIGRTSKPKTKFDIVYSGGLLDHFEGVELEMAFEKHVKLCKKGGYVIIVVPYNSVFMTFVRDAKGVPESKVNYKLFNDDDIANLMENNNLQVVYNKRAAISIRPHIANKRPLLERLKVAKMWAIHNIGTLWKLYECCEKIGIGSETRPNFVRLSNQILKYGEVHGDYLITIGRKK